MVKNSEKAILLAQLNSNKMDSAVVENDKSGKGEKEKELDLKLHDAVCDSDDIDEIQSLVDDEPALIYLRDEKGRTPLHNLVIHRDDLTTEIASILVGVQEQSGVLLQISRPDLINLQDRNNLTALHYAALNRQEELVKALLKWGGDPFVTDGMGNTPLHLLAAEGMMISALACGTQLLNNDTKNELINMVNSEDKTALHKAIDSKATQFVNFLLKPNNGFHLSLKDKSGKNILHYVCSSTGETDESCQIAAEIVHRFSPSYLNEVDNLGRTALHWAAVQRLPKLASILVGEDSTDVTKIDKVGKTPLHYACQNGRYPKGDACVDVLISRPVPESFNLMNYLFLMKDNQDNTPFTYACLNCSVPTVLKYLTIVPEPENWLTNNYMALLYKESPLALTTLMDKSITEDAKRTSESEDDILVDYGPITGYTDPLNDSKPHQETKYLKQGLNWEYETQREVLLHPLVQLFILRKWSKLGWIIGLWVIWQLIWLGAFTTLIIKFYTATSEANAATYVAATVMLLYVLTSLFNEMFEVFKVGFAYLINHNNWAQLARNIFAIISTYPVFTGAEEPLPWQKYSAATGVLLAYVLSMRDIGKLHSKIGLVVEVLKQVLIQIVRVLLFCAPLWIGFTLAFVVIFEDDETLNSSFPGPLVKVLVMMTGEFEYKDTLNVGEDKKLMRSYIVIRFLFFLTFLVAVPVAFFNLLTGFALDKVMELRERAKVGRVAEQLEHIYFVESILLSLRPLLKILFSSDAVSNWFRKLNVTTAWLDQKFTFYTIQRERMTRQAERRVVKGKAKESTFSGYDFPFCEKKLAREVEEKIYALASSSSQK